MQSTAPITTVNARTLAGSRPLRFSTFCALYFAQGVPSGFVNIALAALLSERGASPVQVGGIVALATLPWTFKIFWGPIIDSYTLPIFGRRRPWIIFAQLMMALTLLTSISTHDLTNSATIGLIGMVMFIHNCFASLQDVATDAMAIDVLDEHERGRMNAFMWASKLLGYSVGGAGLASVIAVANIDVAMRIMVGMLLVIMLLPILVREKGGDKLFPWSGRSNVEGASTFAAPPSAGRAAAPRPNSTNPLKVAKELCRAFATRATFLGLIIAFVANIADGFSTPLMSNLYTQRLSWSAEHYSHMQGIWGLVGQLVGAIGGGLLCDRLGTRRIIAIGSIFAVAVFAAFSLTSGLWANAMYPHGVFFMLLQGAQAMTTVALFAMFMSMSWTAAAATQFTLYMTISNLGAAFGPTLTRLHLDGPGAFMLCAVASALPLAILPWIDLKAMKARREAKSGATRKESPESDFGVVAVIPELTPAT